VILASSSRYLVGLIGSGITTSLSPALHEEEADRLGLRYLYQPIDLAELQLGGEAVRDLLVHARLLGYRGLNITHPYKQLVLNHVDELSPEAAAAGAVNTVVFEGGKTTGHNTDAFGFEQNFVRGLFGAATDRIVLLGAGGAGSAVAYALLRLGAARIVVVDPASERADRLAATLQNRFGRDRVTAASPGELPAQLHGADGLVNASPVGMASNPASPASTDLLRDSLWVAEVVYRPLETELLRAARQRGCRTLDGGGMAVFQAAGAFELFTGQKPDAERMLEHFASLVAAEVIAGDGWGLPGQGRHRPL